MSKRSISPPKGQQPLIRSFFSIKRLHISESDNDSANEQPLGVLSSSAPPVDLLAGTPSVSNISRDSQELSAHVLPISQTSGETTISNISDDTNTNEYPLPILQDFEKLPDLMPFEKYGNCTRSMQKQWFVDYKWLKLNEDMQTCHCSVCLWAITNRRIKPMEKGNRLGTSKWLKTGNDEGWRDIKKGKNSLDRHVGGNQSDHNNAWSVFQMEQNKHIVDYKVDRIKLDEIERNRTGLRAIFDCLMTCATQGLALRGHGDEKETSNIWYLTSLVSRFNQEVNTYFAAGTRLKFMSPDIHNEIIKLMSDRLTQYFITLIKQESTAGEAKKKGRFFYSVIMDETQDIRRREQVSVCIRHVDAELKATETFFGFFHATTTDADTLFSILKDALQTLNLPFDAMRGQGYDGAANMSGIQNGLQAKVRAENAKALWIYCFGHNLNLVVQDSMEAVRDVENALEKMHGVINFIKKSSKRYEVFKEMVASAILDNPRLDKRELRPLCPSRWVMRLPSIESLLLHYPTILAQLELLQDDRALNSEIRAEARAFYDLLNHSRHIFVFEFFKSCCH